MMLRTHLAIVVFVILLFIRYVNSQLFFIFVVLISTMLPDIDTGFSTIGKFKGFKFLQFFVKHRGLIHSFTFCIFISLILAAFWPAVSFGFFLGYGVHLFVDSFTAEGIMPFWPYKKKSSWRLRTGRVVESGVFLIFVLLDILLLILRFF